MSLYRLAGQEIYCSCPVQELESSENNGYKQRTAEQAVPFIAHPFIENKLISRTRGLVGGAQHLVEVYDLLPGFLLKVSGGDEFYVTSQGDAIVKAHPQKALSQLDREIITGPALVLALALQDVWSLHASAAINKETTIVFLGESGDGKSTLAAYMAQNAGWRLVADDILPVTVDSSGVLAWPRFPQLKLPLASQPGPHLPEQLPLGKIVLLSPAGMDAAPAVQLLPVGEAVKVLLSHTAGTRLFDPDLLGRHLAFCTRSAEQVPVYRLAYPHRREALPVIKEILENLC